MTQIFILSMQTPNAEDAEDAEVRRGKLLIHFDSVPWHFYSALLCVHRVLCVERLIYL